jgi:hypothetical protein
MVAFEHDHEAVLPEWLKAIAAQGKRIPDEAIPLLLDLGRKRGSLRDLINPVAGARGRWLAMEATPKDWGWIAMKNPERVWIEGLPAKRREVLEYLRKTDPAKARELLQDGWDTTNVKDRERYISALWLGLSAEDEPFLEAALDDSFDDVKRIAREMLATIPESRFYARMVARAEAAITLKKNKKGETSFDIKMLETLDDSMKRDGFNIPNGMPDAEKSKTLMLQLLSRIRPEWWRNHFALTTDEVLQAFESTKTALPLYLLTLNGAYMANDTATIETLLTAHIDKLKTHYAGLSDPFGLLSPDAAERVLTNALAHPEAWVTGKVSDIFNTGVLSTMISGVTFQWSEALTRAFLERLGKYLSGDYWLSRTKDALNAEKKRPSNMLRELLTHLALYLPPQLFDEILTTIDVPTDTPNLWETVVDHMRFTLEFRRQMLAAIHSSSNQQAG